MRQALYFEQFNLDCFMSCPHKVVVLCCNYLGQF